MGNDDIVTKDSPSAGEESPEATPEAVVEPTMAEQIATGVTQAMNEALPRLKQSIHDTVRSEASRNRPEDGANAGIRQALKGWDGSDGRTIEQVLDEADKDAQLKTYQTRDAETLRQQEQIDQGKLLYDNFLRSMKIDPSDSQVDWARDEADVPKAVARFNESVAKILQTREKPAEKAKVDDNNFVDTAQTVSVKAFSIPTKKADFGPWLDKLPYSVYKEHKKEIEVAHNSGQMK